MDPRTETAFYVAAACGLITAGLVFYGSGFKLRAWALIFGLGAALLIFGVGSAYLGAS